MATAAEAALRTGRLSAAERELRRLIQLQPGHPAPLQQLSRLLTLEGRRWESVPYFLDLVRLQACDVEELVLMGGVELAVDIPDEFLKASPTAVRDPLISLWEAQKAGRDEDPARVEALLSQVIAALPGQIEAQAKFGTLLVETVDPARWQTWHAQLPSGADEHPEIWAVRGIRAQKQNELRAAARCFWESVRRDADHRGANYRLSQVLAALKESDSAELFFERSRKLQELESAMYVLDKAPNDLGQMRRAAELTESLGRLWEAAGWCRAALKRDPQLAWPRDGLNRLQSELTPSPPRVVPSANPALRVDLSSYPLPKWDSSIPSARHISASDAPSSISFEDVAATVGIRFSYFNGGNPQGGVMHMYEFSGGGVAVLDYDGDGWPDLYFTQGCVWPPAPGQREHLDRLYRNLGTGKFQDVTAAARAGDGRFSQGATVGDFDNDGFPDLYVGNIGANRLYHNQGDGTFTDVSDVLPAGGDGWTTSCLMADVNGDTWPDLYAVRYVAADDVFSRLCRQDAKRGAVGSCPPGVFDGDPDRLYLNLGDGRFQEVSEQSGIALASGKGLGIVAADFDGSGKLSIFIANDEVPNFYFVNQVEARGAVPKFAERAPLVGLAYDEGGATKAGMGIAAGDADGDGLLDLVVTNFYHEASTLYRQQSDRLFVDDTRRSGLWEPSLTMLGFGAQFLDADLDGLPDLVVTNGHVDDYSVSQQPYRMRPQVFHNVGNCAFRELESHSLGSFFESAYLGRGLARLDWNRDGHEDFAVSHLDVPAALLSNQSVETGNSLSVRLRGVASDRDAIGAAVSVTCGTTTAKRQLTAGDGYQASNQRELVFGLGRAERVDELTIRWPSGLTQAFSDIAAGQEILIIEGSADPLLFSRPALAGSEQQQ